MNTNLYLVEKFDSAHRENLLQEAARDRRSADLYSDKAHVGWRTAGKLGALLVKVGNWLERSAQRNGWVTIGS
jgi:hypothetical protein